MSDLRNFSARDGRQHIVVTCHTKHRRRTERVYNFTVQALESAWSSQAGSLDQHELVRCPLCGATDFIYRFAASNGSGADLVSIAFDHDGTFEAYDRLHAKRLAEVRRLELEANEARWPNRIKSRFKKFFLGLRSLSSR
jgi:hypothetical protein